MSCVLFEIIGGKNIGEEFQKSVEKLKDIADNDGLSEDDLNCLVDFLIATELSK